MNIRDGFSAITLISLLPTAFAQYRESARIGEKIVVTGSSVRGVPTQW